MKFALFSIRKLSGYFGLSAMLFCLSTESQAQSGTLVAGWHFNAYAGATTIDADYGTGTIYLNGTQGSSSWTGLANFGGDAGNISGFPTPLPGAGASLSLVGTDNNGKSLVFKFSMTGYAGLDVSFTRRGTATGYNTGTWAYSTNGTTWTAIAGNTATTATSFSVTSLNDITGLDNATDAYLRYTLNGASTSSGNNRMDNVQLRATPTPLAITLGNISVTNKGNRNTIEWNSLTEDEGDIFEIERSNNGADFNNIVRLTASGKPGQYQYTDEQPYSGINYYRLRMLNHDGTRTISKIVSAVVKERSFEISVYPNPVTDEVSINVKGAQENAKVMITDATGRLVSIRTLSAGSETIITDLSQYAAGLYLVNYEDSTNKKTIKINKSN